MPLGQHRLELCTLRSRMHWAERQDAHIHIQEIGAGLSTMMKDSKDSGSISLLVSFFFLHLLFYLDKDTGRCCYRNYLALIPNKNAKSWLIGKDPDAGRDWGQEEKGMTEDEMAGYHHRLDGHEFE